MLLASFLRASTSSQVEDTPLKKHSGTVSCPYSLLFLPLLAISLNQGLKDWPGLAWLLPFLGDLPSAERLHSDW